MALHRGGRLSDSIQTDQMTHQLLTKNRSGCVCVCVCVVPAMSLMAALAMKFWN